MVLCYDSPRELIHWLRYICSKVTSANGGRQPGDHPPHPLPPPPVTHEELLLLLVSVLARVVLEQGLTARLFYYKGTVVSITARSLRPSHGQGWYLLHCWGRALQSGSLAAACLGKCMQEALQPAGPGHLARNPQGRLCLAVPLSGIYCYET